MIPTIRYKMDCDGVDWDALRDALVADDFHNGRSIEQYQLSFENTHTVVFAYDEDDIVGTARALSDGVCNAYVVDVWTKSSHRKQGIARKMMELMLKNLQGQHVYLWTDDQQAFYEAIGMEKDAEATGYFTVVGHWLNTDWDNL